MTDLSDDELYAEGVRRMQPEDESLLFWYARLDMTTRHRLWDVANERDTDRGDPDSVITGPRTLAGVLAMLLTSGAYMQEMVQIKRSLKGKLEKTVEMINQ